MGLEKIDRQSLTTLQKITLYDTYRRPPDEPSRGTATRADAEDNLKQQADMDILYQAEIKRYLYRKDTLEQNLMKAYALIFST
jgi:hypothetical protein